MKKAFKIFKKGSTTKPVQILDDGWTKEKMQTKIEFYKDLGFTVTDINL